MLILNRGIIVVKKLVISSFVIPFYYGSASAKTRSYGSYGSGSATLPLCEFRIQIMLHTKVTDEYDQKHFTRKLGKFLSDFSLRFQSCSPGSGSTKPNYEL
jgi:hypothetical protein